MSDAVPATQEAAPGPIDYQPPATSQEALSIDDAMRLWTEPPKEEEEQAEAPAKAAEQPESAQADADPETDPGDQQTQADEPEAELPPIEPPRSWTKEEKEAFAKWPREAQESISRVASTREAEFRRSQNEAAESRKALEAELAQAAQARQQYEARQTAYTKALEDALQNEFGDIQTLNDVRKLQAEDPFRFQQWQLRQMELSTAKAEQQANEQRAAEEKRNSWAKFTKAESDAFENEVPEFKAKKEEYAKRAAEVLLELGFTDAELAKFASGEDKIALFDRRMQRLLFDRIKLSEIRSAPPKAIPKPVPPVQRPGAKQSSGAAQAQSLQALNQKLSASGSLDDAMALLMAQRKAS